MPTLMVSPAAGAAASSAAGAVVASAAGAAAGAAQAVISSESSVNKVIQREQRDCGSWQRITEQPDEN